MARNRSRSRRKESELDGKIEQVSHMRTTTMRRMNPMQEQIDVLENRMDQLDKVFIHLDTVLIRLADAERTIHRLEKRCDAFEIYIEGG